METKNQLIMAQPKKLIEVAMPIKEISAESIRDDRIQHGHISSLHKWWARRPLPVCRAVVFASLIPDPMDKNCPVVFRDAVSVILGKSNNNGDPYKPYDDIPYTSANDKMDDNLRNRLLMFIGKFSERYIINERHGKKTDAKDLLSDASLIKWDNKNNKEIIEKAQKLIWVSHHLDSGLDVTTLLKQFDHHIKSIKDSEELLYNTTDRHIKSSEVLKREENLKETINAFLDKMPKVFDPFAGGGAIPLEAARLGCRSYGNDLNPIAHIIQKGSLEFPQKYGKPISYSKLEFIKKYPEEDFNSIPSEYRIIANGRIVGIRIPNRLSYDVEYYVKEVLKSVEKRISHYYPNNERGVKPIAYYWARVGTCINPTCRAEVPLLRQFYLAATERKKVHLKPIINGNQIDFEIRNGRNDEIGWIDRGNLTCPCCHNITDINALKEQFIEGLTKERLLAIIWDGEKGKEYSLPMKEDLKILETLPDNIEVPSESMPVQYTQALPCCTWGFEKWGQLFSKRQLIALQTIVDELNKLKINIYKEEDDYLKAVFTYLGIWLDRLAARMTTFGLIDLGGEKIVDLFGRQAIPMVLDYPEFNIFNLEQVSWISKVIQSEGIFPFCTEVINTSSGNKTQFGKKEISAVITDPPYYDAIAYADLSDFFYVWLKRVLNDVYPFNFSTPQTPKSEECTALKHHHHNDLDKAKEHFEHKLLEIFDAIEQQTSHIVSIMFAHQSTEAWTTLCNSILNSRMNITGSWAIDTEKKGGLKEKKAFLSSSVTVSCKPSQRNGFANYQDVKKAINVTVAEEVNKLYALGLRGADLLTACFGQAVSEFGKYERVEKADGNEVTISELLEMARESAFNALLKGFDGDDFTKFYIGWLQLYGFSESDFDDAAKFARVGLTINVADLFAHNLFIKKGNKQELAGYKERLELNNRIGEGSHSFIIDFVHKAMSLYEGANRNALLAYIAKVAASPDNSFWRVITSLCEILPQGSDDYKQASGLLLNKDSLIRESKNIQQSAGAQGQLF